MATTAPNTTSNIIVNAVSNISYRPLLGGASVTPYNNHKFWNTVSTEILYTAYGGSVGILLHINGKFTIGILKPSPLS
jgi:hypothetical protein